MRAKQIHEKYHSRTKAYSQIISERNFTYRIILPFIKKNLEGRPKKILDIGCGSGTLSLYLASQGHSVHGIDISRRAINICVQSAKDLGIKNVTFEVINFLEDKITNQKYDVILLLEVIEHLENDIASLKKIYHKLNPGGLLILSTPSSNAPLYRLGLTRDFDKKVGHLRRYQREELVKKIQHCGFQVIEINNNEGLIRNFLFTNIFAGYFVRFIKFFLVEVVTTIDNWSLRLFGESDYIVIAKKLKTSDYVRYKT